MPDVLHEKPGLHEPHGAKTPRKAALASWIGSAVQYYDFFLYGTAAALVFPDLFFPTADPSSARLASFATFGVAYAARTIGAVVLGHFGDRIGRKTMLIFTLLLMGASTIAIGLLPTYAQVGILAPILLVVLRLLQGLSAAGEQAGANSMALEHAPADRRGYFTSFTLSGTQMELILATLVFLPIGALPEDALQSWGWRVPFLLSTIVVAVGLWVRRALPETPAFEEVDEGTRRPPSPPPSCSARTASTSCASSSAPSSPWSARSSPSSRCRTPSTRSASRARACSASSSRPTSSRSAPSPVRGAVRPDRSQACLHLRLRRLRRTHLALHVGDRPRELPARLPARRAAVRCRLQRGERRVALVLRRDVRTPACATPAWPSARRSASRSRASRR